MEEKYLLLRLEQKQKRSDSFYSWKTRILLDDATKGIYDLTFDSFEEAKEKLEKIIKPGESWTILPVFYCPWEHQK